MQAALVKALERITSLEATVQQQNARIEALEARVQGAAPAPAPAARRASAPVLGAAPAAAARDKDRALADSLGMAYEQKLRDNEAQSEVAEPASGPASEPPPRLHGRSSVPALPTDAPRPGSEERKLRPKSEERHVRRPPESPASRRRSPSPDVPMRASSQGGAGPAQRQPAARRELGLQIASAPSAAPLLASCSAGGLLTGGTAVAGVGLGHRAGAEPHGSGAPMQQTRFGAADAGTTSSGLSSASGATPNSARVCRESSRDSAGGGGGGGGGGGTSSSSPNRPITGSTRGSRSSPLRRLSPPPAPPAPPTLQQVASLRGQHDQPITSLVVSDCGTGLVAAGLDGQLHLWARGEGQGLGTTMRSAQQWRRTRTQAVGAGEINGLSLLGENLAAACQDGTVRVFRMRREMGTWMLYSVMHPLLHTSPTRSGAPPGGGNGIGSNGAAGGGNGGTAGGGGAAAAATSGHEVMCVGMISGSGTRHAPLLFSAAQDGLVCVWNSTSGAWLETISAHGGWVMALAAARRGDESLLVTGSFDQTVKVWVKRAEALGPGPGTLPKPGADGGGSWALEHTLTGHTDGVLAIELSRSRRLAFSGGNDHTVRVWSLAKGQCLFTLSGRHERGVCAISLHHASGCLVTGSEDGTVGVWDTIGLEAGGDEPPPEPQLVGPKLTLAHEDDGTHAEVLTIVPSADGTALFCGLDDGNIALLGAGA